ncbi:hypothetical protein GA565_08375 [Rouxiella sp. S1S-2]|uniref:hypothetical protein n=1 Tax=Rouxiella sp. S1S-2 TaxID=2653856 RepID=UPI001265089C|nr:hypothetical protein [Rouxiella sp. S1S-2]KAB7896002.1 hypothetical protein GA565_08375 [Rouxiella sp. S1S-2]
MTVTEVKTMLDCVRQAYQDSLDGKAVSFTGLNGRAVTHHDPVAMRKELEYWETRYQRAIKPSDTHKLARFT